MTSFNLHFFKEKSRQIDIDTLIAFFEDIPGFRIEMDNQSVRFLYQHPRLGHTSRFLITPKSTVPDIYRLNPRFLDLNFRLEMPLLTPNYVANHLFEIVKKVCQRFDFHIYNEMFEDVLPFKSEVLLKVFEMLKGAYIEKNPVIMSNYFLMETEKLKRLYRYLDDYSELQKYYDELETYVPRYHFLQIENKQLVIGIEWQEQTLTVLPPDIDYIFYRIQDEIRPLPTDAVRAAIDPYLLDVPGFIKGTKVVPKKQLKRVHRILKRRKFPVADHRFEKVELKQLLDL
ncbi:MAG: hypothetical protein WC225_04105 [Acholeplasmataceae bacterium]|nr:hypothetical protein [Acholeplasmataceae bacterium]